MLRKVVLLALNTAVFAVFSPSSLPWAAGLTLLGWLLIRWMEGLEGGKRTALAAAGCAVFVGLWASARSFMASVPLGLSFYTFKILSVYFDVCRKKRPAEKNLLTWSVYVTLFCEILSGPVSRQEELGLERPGFTDKAHVENGLLLICRGLFRKFVLANRLAVYADTVFLSWEACIGPALLAAVLFYSLQLYLDFSGYSDLALGAGSLCGLDIPENFRRPYFALGIRDFWRRWHISLSSWLRDYVYIPLGGSRRGKLRRALNVMVTFLVSGFWHGCGTGFLLWGAYHGAMNLLPVPKVKTWAGKGLLRLGTFLCCALGWVFFRLERAGDGFRYLGRLLTTFRLTRESLTAAVLPFSGDNTALSIFAVLMVLLIVEWVFELRREKRSLKDEASAAPAAVPAGYAVFCLVCTLVLGTFGQSGFLYMNF